MRIRLISANGAYVYERSEIIYGEESCKYASHEVISDAPYRVIEEYICDDQSAILVYDYEETNDQIYRRATIYLTFKTRSEELIGALSKVIELLKEGRIRASNVYVELAETESRILEEEKEMLKEKLMEVLDSL